MKLLSRNSVSFLSTNCAESSLEKNREVEVELSKIGSSKKGGQKRPIRTESSFVSHGSMEEVHGYRRSSSVRAVYCMGQKAFFARSPPRELFLSSPEKQSMRERGTRLSSETKTIFHDLAHPHRIGEREFG